MGFSNFKIVERNTPTELLELRVRAYTQGYYHGNLLDLVQNYAYPRSVMTGRDDQMYSLKRMARYFFRPGEVNLLRFRDVIAYGKELSLLYPREGDNPVYVDNQALDGFLDRFEKQGCENLDCERCRYCHRWADRVVRMDQGWVRRMTRRNERLLGSLHDGSLWESPLKTLSKAALQWIHQPRSITPNSPSPAGVAVPGRNQRRFRGRPLPVVQPKIQATSWRSLSVGNAGPHPHEALAPRR